MGVRPSDNAILTAHVLWGDACRDGTPDGWYRCAGYYGAIAFYLHVAGNLADLEYLNDMYHAALDMMEAK